MRANPLLQEKLCCRQEPPFLLKGGSSKGHRAGRPRERAAQHPAGFGCLWRVGRTSEGQSLAPIAKGSIVGSAVSSTPQGNLFDFLRLTEWRGPRVLYFGDHLYSDLAVRGRAFP